jgi:hypothetical protein
MADAAGWQPDPEDADQELERYWSGSEWTDQVRPALSVRPYGAPDHSPQLHRAMSAATADLDAVDDRISTLFDRADDAPVRGGRTAARAAAVGVGAVEGAGTVAEAATSTGTVTATDEDDIIDIFGDLDADIDGADHAAPLVRDGGLGIHVDRMAIISQYEDDIGGAFSDLDAELAAEEPDESEKAKRRRFGRRAKGTTAAQH